MTRSFLLRGQEALPQLRWARGYLVGLAFVLVVGIVIVATHSGRATVARSLADVGHARPAWLGAAALAFAIGLLCCASAWRAGVQACGGTVSRTQAIGRYSVGSLVNAVTPANVGGAIRLGLFARVLEGSDRLWRMGGICTAVGVARALALAALVVTAAVATGLPFWPAPVLAAVAIAAAVLLGRLRRIVSGRAASALEIFAVFARAPRKAVGLSLWVAASVAARVVAAAAIAVALGLPAPWTAALVLLPALALSNVFPLTPGNFGTGAGAATLVLHSTGVSFDVALATGLAFQAVETLAGVSLGLAGILVVAVPVPHARRLKLVAACAGAAALGTFLSVVAVQLV